MKNHAIIRLLAALLLVLSGGSSAFAQSKPAAAKPALAPAGPALKTCQGEYEGSQATYTYYVGEDGQRVRHGSFVSVRTQAGRPIFLRIAGQLITSNDYTEYRASRTYAHGQATGCWTTTETDYSRSGGPHTPLPAEIRRRQTTTETYAGGKLDGPATYADVPWKNGQSGTPAASASARRHVRPERVTVVVPRRSMFDRSGDDDEHPRTERDTTLAAEDYAAGPYRYDAAPSADDPARRPQTARGYFDAQGYCDSTWTLHYWKGGNERDEATAIEQASGWMSTTLEFEHGVLRREQTTQASTGAVISRFVLPATQPQDTAARLVLLGEEVRLHNWANPANHPDEPDWNSPIAEEEDASHSFFTEAVGVLGPPRLLNIELALAATAADSAALQQAETALKQAHAQFPDSTLGEQNMARLPAGVPMPVTVAHLSSELYRLVAAKYVDEAPARTTDYLRHDLLNGDHSFLNRHDNPYPWLRNLTEANPPLDQLRKSQKSYLTHLASIRLRTRQLQARLALAGAPATAPTLEPAKP